jgi:hypothetical protein
MLYGTPEKSSVDFPLTILEKTLQHITAHGISHRLEETTEKGKKIR